MHSMNNEQDISWHDVRNVCSEIKKVMDGMIGEQEFACFRPGLARAIAGARDAHQATTWRARPPPNAICQV